MEARSYWFCASLADGSQEIGLLADWRGDTSSALHHLHERYPDWQMIQLNKLRDVPSITGRDARDRRKAACC